jgi:predicted transcriptional regulator
VAAEVDGDRITDEQVDAFAEVLCSIGGVPSTESGVPTRSARFASLQILLSNELAADVADVDDAPGEAVSSILQGMAAARDAVPDDLQETFDEVAEEFARAQSAIAELGRQSLEESGQTKEITQEAAYAEGEKLVAAYAQDADIEVDPRFGEMVDGTLQPGNGSLSVPVSDLAVEGSAPEVGEGLVSQLPASQKCASPS